MRAQAQEKTCEVWVGVDVSKERFEAAVAEEGDAIEVRRIVVESFARTRAGVRGFLHWIGPITARLAVVMEATGKYSLELATWLRAEGPELVVAIVNPAWVAAYQKSLGMRNKTDRVDARVLSLYGRERRPRPYEPMGADREELQALSRQRDALLGMLVSERQRAEEGTTSEMVRQIQREHIGQLQAHLERIEKGMEEVVGRSADLARDVALLDTIPGVGRHTAMVVLAEVGDLRRFARSRQLSAFAGVSPQVCESGSSVRKRTRLCKAGNARVRSALYMASLSIIERKNRLGAFYQHLVEGGKAKRAAMGAVMRKMLVLMRALLRSGDRYHEDYHALGRHTR
jgi:transposase